MTVTVKTEADIFEQGLVQKVRFESPDKRVGGELTMEHLHDLSLVNLNSIAVKVAAAIGSAPVISFIDTTEVDEATRLNKLRLEILVHIINKKKEAAAKKSAAAVERENVRRRKQAAAEAKNIKEASAYANMTIEELDAILAE